MAGRGSAVSGLVIHHRKDAGAPPRLGQGHPNTTARRSYPPVTELAPFSPKGKVRIARTRIIKKKRQRNRARSRREAPDWSKIYFGTSLYFRQKNCPVGDVGSKMKGLAEAAPGR